MPSHAFPKTQPQLAFRASLPCTLARFRRYDRQPLVGGCHPRSADDHFGAGAREPRTTAARAHLAGGSHAAGACPKNLPTPSVAWGRQSRISLDRDNPFVMNNHSCENFVSPPGEWNRRGTYCPLGRFPAVRAARFGRGRSPSAGHTCLRECACLGGRSSAMPGRRRDEAYGQRPPPRGSAAPERTEGQVGQTQRAGCSDPKFRAALSHGRQPQPAGRHAACRGAPRTRQCWGNAGGRQPCRRKRRAA